MGDIIAWIQLASSGKKGADAGFSVNATHLGAWIEGQRLEGDKVLQMLP